MDTQQQQQQRDEQLWKLAKKRAAFRQSLMVYVVINAFLVGVWYFSSGPKSYFWPIWVMLGWGIGIVFQYLAAYRQDNFFSAAEEYDKLKNQQKQ